MSLPLLQETVDDLKHLYEGDDNPSCDAFEHYSYCGYTVDEIKVMVDKEVAKEYAAWIYENEK